MQSQVKFNWVRRRLQRRSQRRFWESLVQGQVSFQQVQQGFQHLALQHASERFVKIKRCGCWGCHRSLFFFWVFWQPDVLSNFFRKNQVFFFQMCSVDFPVITSIASTKSQMAARQALPETGGLLYTSAARCDCRRNFWSQLGRRVAPISNGLSSFSQFCMVIWWYTLLSNTPGF